MRIWPAAQLELRSDATPAQLERHLAPLVRPPVSGLARRWLPTWWPRAMLAQRWEGTVRRDGFTIRALWVVGRCVKLGLPWLVARYEPLEPAPGEGGPRTLLRVRVVPAEHAAMLVMLFGTLSAALLFAGVRALYDGAPDATPQRAASAILLGLIGLPALGLGMLHLSFRRQVRQAANALGATLPRIR